MISEGAKAVDSESIKDYMRYHFENTIEEGLWTIEKNRQYELTNMRKLKLGCPTEPPSMPCDFFSFEGNCYALAIFLWSKRQDLRLKKSRQ